MATQLYYTPFIPAFNNIGVPIAEAKLYFYYTSTATLAPIYADAEATVPLTNPVVANLAGKYPDIYLDKETVYRVVQTDKFDAPIGDAVDPYLPGNIGTVFIATPGTNARARTVLDKLRESVSILDYKNDDGTIPGSGGDDTTAFTKALATGRRVFIPGGLRIKCNIVTPPSFHIYGETSKLSIIQPYDMNKPAIKVAWDNLYWSYNRTIEDLLIDNGDSTLPGHVAKTGVGVALGRNGPTDFISVGPYPQYSGGMTLRNVSFRNLSKGFYAGAGNIGVEFYSCNAAGCYYGFYFSDNKNTVANGNLSPPTGQPGDTSAGDAMHAGNKYFYGGEIDECVCGVYIHNVTEGFGCVAFYGTIIEYNSIGVYYYTNNAYCPISFHDVWNEGNGQTSPTVPRDNVTIDQWSGATRSNLSILARTLIVEGTRSAVNYYGGFFTDVRMTATNSRITARDCQVEYQLGYGGGGFYVDDNSSTIVIDGPKTLGGIGAFPNVITSGCVHTEASGSPANPTAGYEPGSTAAARYFGVAPRLNKQFGSGTYATGGTESLSIAYTKPRPFVGFTNYTPVISPGGRTFPLVSNFDITTTLTSHYLVDPNATFTTNVAGWYIITYDIRRVDGLDVQVFIGDLDTTQIIAGQSTRGTEWMTVAALVYLPTGRTFYPAFQPVSVGRTVFQFSAYQVRRFNTRLEAETYIRDGIYVVDGDDLYMDQNVRFNWKGGAVSAWRIGPNSVTGTFEMSADPATAKRWDMSGFGIRLDANYGAEWSWAGNAGNYSVKVDTASSGDLLLDNNGAGSGVLRSGLHINLNGKELRVSGNKVVTSRQSAVGLASNTAAAPTQAEFNALVDKFNSLITKLGTAGHGLIAD